MFLNKIWDFLLGIFHPAAGEIPRQTRDCLTHISIGRLTVFAHVVLFVVQTPTAQLVFITGVTRFQIRKIFQPPAGRKKPSFFTKIYIVCKLL